MSAIEQKAVDVDVETSNQADSNGSLLATLKQQLAALIQCQAYHFDPVRFHFLETMAQRSEQLNTTKKFSSKQSAVNLPTLTSHTTVSQLLANKALQATAQYQSDFEQAKTSAKDTLALIDCQFPTASPTALQHFEQCRFKSLQQLLMRLKRDSQQHLDAQHSLKSLNQTLASRSVTSATTQISNAWDEALQQQDNEARQRLIVNKNKPGGSSGNVSSQLPHATDALRELKSSQRFRRTLVKQATARTLSKAIHDSPTSAGPLNPQKLALRALNRMQEISPAYLNRLISTLDTLLWLEQVSKQATKTLSKKNSRRKN